MKVRNGIKATNGDDEEYKWEQNTKARDGKMIGKEC